MAARPDPDVSIVVPTFRRPAALRATLEALAGLDFPPERHEVIVVDDASDDSTREVVEATGRSTAAAIRYAAQPSSGVATARNHGARLARGHILVFLDDDMLVEPGHLDEHLATQEAHGPGLVNGHWEFAPEVRRDLERTPFGRFRLGVEDWVKEAITKEPLGDSCEVPSGITACNLSIRTEVFHDLGGFDEDFPLAGCEDQEFSARAADARLPFVYNRGISLFHNDHRVTLRQFGERQEQGALTAVYLATKRPAEYAGRALIAENTPIARGDRPAVIAKKILKSALSRDPLLESAHLAVGLLERVRPGGRVLQRAYWWICGLYIYRGVQRGVRTRPGSDSPWRT